VIFKSIYFVSFYRDFLSSKKLLKNKVKKLNDNDLFSSCQDTADFQPKIDQDFWQRSSLSKTGKLAGTWLDIFLTTYELLTLIIWAEVNYIKRDQRWAY